MFSEELDEQNFIVILDSWEITHGTTKTKDFEVKTG